MSPIAVEPFLMLLLEGYVHPGRTAGQISLLALNLCIYIVNGDGCFNLKHRCPDENLHTTMEMENSVGGGLVLVRVIS